MKNHCAKTVKRENAYEVWKSRDGSWTWHVLKKYQADDNKQYARWFCDVTSPIVGDAGELGDVYVRDIKSQATCVKRVNFPPYNSAPVVVTGTEKTWEPINSAQATQYKEAQAPVVIGTPNPAAFLRGDVFDRFFN